MFNVSNFYLGPELGLRDSGFWLIEVDEPADACELPLNPEGNHFT